MKIILYKNSIGFVYECSYLRNEKIRTYNFNRHMITDHRLSESKTVINIVSFLTGDLGFDLLHGFHQSLEKLDRAEKLEELIKSSQSC